MKSILPALAIASALTFNTSTATVALAQAAPAQTAEEADDAAYEYAFDTVMSTMAVNESCKSALEPTMYNGFRVMLRVYMAELGATDEDVKKSEDGAAQLSDYICDDKSACWRSVVALAVPKTATIEDGRAKCKSYMLDAFEELDDMFGGDDNSAIAKP